jgi:NADPH2:quinone reductase
LRTGFEVYLRKRLFELVEGRLSYGLEYVDIFDVAAAAHRQIIDCGRMPKMQATCGTRSAGGVTVWYAIFIVVGSASEHNHAAAGGVGLIAGQWLKALGVRAIGTVSTPEKAELAKAHGYAEVIVTGDSPDFAREVRRLTDGAGVPVVYDGVGKDTFSGSLDCLQPRGMMVSFGNASGAVPPFSIATLAAKGSLFLTRPILGSYAASREALLAMAADLFGAIDGGSVRIEINQTYPLAEAARAHRDLAARKTTGSTLLLP